MAWRERRSEYSTKEREQKERNGEEERAGTENEGGRWIRKGTIEGSRKRKKERKAIQNK
jgi:hypothetical protein